MCCATKTYLVNLIVWLLTLIGLSPVVPSWIDSIEKWNGYGRDPHPAIYTYASEEAMDHRVFFFTPDGITDTTGLPTIVTAFRSGASQSAARAVLGVCSDLARMGYGALAFEAPFEDDESFGLDWGLDWLLAVAWLAEHAAALGVDVSGTVPMSIAGQPVPRLHLAWGFESQVADLGYSAIVLPEGAERFPAELFSLLPSPP